MLRSWMPCHLLRFTFYALTLTTLICAANVTPADPFGFNTRFQTLNRLARAFPPKGKRLEMHRQEMPGPGIVRHPHGLFRGAMRTDPGTVGANWHNHCLKRTAVLQRPERLRPGRVAAEKNALSFARNQIAIITTVTIQFPTGP